MIALADIWGIGPRTFAKLTALGVATPLQLAERIYRPGFLFKKSGVILSDIVPGRLELSQVLDRMNHKYGVRTVGLAGALHAQLPYRPRPDNDGKYLVSRTNQPFFRCLYFTGEIPIILVNRREK